MPADNLTGVAATVGAAVVAVLRIYFNVRKLEAGEPGAAEPGSELASDIIHSIETGTPQLLDFGVTHERAWEVGLACGGKVKVFVEKLS